MMRPLADRVLIQPSPRVAETASGLVLPAMAVDPTLRGRWQDNGFAVQEAHPDVSGQIVAVGPDVREPSLTQGAVVIFAGGKGHILEVGEQRYLVLRERDVIAVMESRYG